MIQTINQRIKRLERLETELQHQVKNWRYYPVVKTIQAMRELRMLVAVGVVAELGDLRRFDHPRKLMAYLGLVPSAKSRGDKRKQGKLTKCGNGRARRLLIECAQSHIILRLNAKNPLTFQLAGFYNMAVR